MLCVFSLMFVLYLKKGFYITWLYIPAVLGLVFTIWRFFYFYCFPDFFLFFVFFFDLLPLWMKLWLFYFFETNFFSLWFFFLRRCREDSTSKKKWPSVPQLPFYYFACFFHPQNKLLWNENIMLFRYYEGVNNAQVFWCFLKVNNLDHGLYM